MMQCFRKSLICILLSATFTLISGCEEQFVTKVEKVPVEIRTINVGVRDLPVNSILYGRVVAYARADIRPQVDGIILKRNFDEGASVAKGEVLFEIDARKYEVAYNNAKAAYQRAVVSRKMLSRTLERYEKLYKTRAVSAQALDDAKLDYDLALSDERIAKTVMEEAKISLDYTKVRSPIAGFIGKTLVTTGTLVNKNQQDVLATVLNLDKVYVDVQQSARQWRILREEMLDGALQPNVNSGKVRLFFENNKQYPYLGVIELADPIIEQGAGSITLRALFNNERHILLPGMSVSAEVMHGVKKDVALIPTSAVYFDPKGNTFCYVVSGDNRVKQVRVDLGRLTIDSYELISGLKIGDEIAISGLSKLSDNCEVKIVNFQRQEKKDDVKDIQVDVSNMEKGSVGELDGQ